MRRLLLILPMVLVIPACAARPVVRDLRALRQAPLYGFNEWELDRYLRWLSKQHLPTSHKAVLLGRQSIGQPYRLGLLGEYPFELYDPDPTYCLVASDCVTFVEQTYAMALSRNWPSFFRMLQRIRYKQGRIGLLTRNHFMEADWNINNAWLFDDLTASLAGDKAKPMQVRIDRAGLLRRHGIAVDLPMEVVEDVCVPRDALPAVLGQLQDGDIVEFVRGEGAWQWVSHIGLIAHDATGRVTVLHAAAPAVREEPLEGYLGQRAKIVGFKFLRLADGRDEGNDEPPDTDRMIVRAVARPAAAYRIRMMRWPV